MTPFFFIWLAIILVAVASFNWLAKLNRRLNEHLKGHRHYKPRVAKPAEGD